MIVLQFAIVKRSAVTSYISFAIGRIAATDCSAVASDFGVVTDIPTLASNLDFAI